MAVVAAGAPAPEVSLTRHDGERSTRAALDRVA
jgi:hypothetical protein